MDPLLAQAVAEEETERAKRFADAWKLYLGEHEKPLQVVGNDDDNVILNFSGLFVDKGVSFLFGKPLEFQVEPPNQAASDATDEAEDWLASVWRENRAKTLLSKAATNGGVTGHCFLKLVEPAEGGLPRIVNLDPSYMSVVWDDDDIDRVLEYRITFPSVLDGKPIVRRQRHVRVNDSDVWDIHNEKATSFRPTDTAELRLSEFKPIQEPKRWPWPWPAIIDCQNLPMPNEYWGRSDLEKGVADLNASVNRAVSNMARIVRFYGHPRPYATGVTPDQVGVVDAAIDQWATFPQDAQVGMLEMGAHLEAALGFFDRLKASLHEQAHVPVVATEAMESVGSLSGVALEILYQPLLELTETKRGTYGDMLETANSRLLDMGERLTGQDAVVNNVWPKLLPEDPKEQAETAVVRKEVGVSGRTNLEQLGFDPDREAERRAEDGDQAAQAFNNGTAIV